VIGILESSIEGSARWRRKGSRFDASGTTRNNVCSNHISHQDPGNFHAFNGIRREITPSGHGPASKFCGLHSHVMEAADLTKIAVSDLSHFQPSLSHHQTHLGQGSLRLSLTNHCDSPSSAAEFSLSLVHHHILIVVAVIRQWAPASSHHRALGFGQGSPLHSEIPLWTADMLLESARHNLIAVWAFRNGTASQAAVRTCWGRSPE
jgi:hypothetical protein